MFFFDIYRFYKTLEINESCLKYLRKDNFSITFGKDLLSDKILDLKARQKFECVGEIFILDK